MTLTKDGRYNKDDSCNHQFNDEGQCEWCGELNEERFPMKNKKLCPSCSGVGNLDDGAGFALDCIICNGTGWVQE